VSVTSILQALSCDMILGEISNVVPYNALVLLGGRLIILAIRDCFMRSY